jgi:phosphatidylserine/phosphatidylglycerophosphate/cardiolipin synthase-like enzyme
MIRTQSLLSLLCLTLLSLQGLAQIDISSARSLGVGATVTVRGIVTNGSEFGDNIRYLQDNTAGIAAYDGGGMLSGVNRGDSIEITGELTEFASLLEISPITSFTVINSGNPLPDPVELDITSGFNEAYEGQLVQIESAVFTDMGSFGTSSGNYEITDASGVGEVRVNGASNIAGAVIPSDPVDVVGLMGQFDFADPLAGYQLLPRDLLDFQVPGDPPVISTVLTQSNLAQTSFTVSFETLEDGSTIINYGTSEALGSTVSDAALSTTHSADLSGLQAGTIYYVQGVSVGATGDTSYSAITPMATVSASSGNIEVYFNQPVDHSVSTGVNAVYLNQTFDDTIKALIDGAANTLDIAIYNVDIDLGVIDAINNAYFRGVNVRIVANEAVNSTAWSSLIVPSSQKKLSPTGTTSSGEFYGLMHNKVLIIDADDGDPMKPKILTGSTNWTDEQLLIDPNNMIIVQDQSLARAYTLEFEELFGDTWGPDKVANTPTQFLIGDRHVELYFSPSDNVEAQIQRVIASADHDLEFAMFAWTRFNIAYAVEDAVNAGAFAAGVIDGGVDTTDIPWTVMSGVMDPGTLLEDDQFSIFHHKYLMVDAQCPNSDPTVITGSANFSSNGVNRSDENILVIHDPTIANIYYQEFVQRYTDNGGTLLSDLPEDCKIIEDTTGTGIDEIVYQLNAFPNPASNSVQVDLPWTDLTQIELLNLSGQTLKAFQTRGERFVFQVSDLESGFYLLNAHTNSGKRAWTRIIVE